MGDSEPQERTVQALSCIIVGLIGAVVLAVVGGVVYAVFSVVVPKVRSDADEREAWEKEPPFDRAEVVQVRRTAFEDNPDEPVRRPRPQEKRVGIGQVKDEIYEDLVPMLGDAKAVVPIDCGDAVLRDEVFVCTARYKDIEIDYRVSIHKLKAPLPVPGNRKATWEQTVRPVRMPLFREAVHAKAWERTRSSGEKPYCDRMPRRTMVERGEPTEYRCYARETGEVARGHKAWNTYRVETDSDGRVELAYVEGKKHR
ncbi:hypothetical protein [Streptomyces sulphureus]|uniref:hypothetical protein n=1 Tax=Streptomyces sulphureus TaxID=47758 RepID=UPI000381A3D1|nr:hypothetical protein [Streptomyces sulphureus]